MQIEVVLLAFVTEMIAVFSLLIIGAKRYWTVKKFNIWVIGITLIIASIAVIYTLLNPTQ